MSSLLRLEHFQKHSLRKNLEELKSNHIFRKATLIFCFYTLTTLVYYYNEKNWSVVDCVYFVTVTIATVGYGDYYPTGNGTKVFTIFVILFGLTVIFSFISEFANHIIDIAAAAAKEIAKNEKSDIVEIDESKYIWKKVYCFLVIAAAVAVCAIYMYCTEGWSFITAIYFAVVTTTTVGYGDITVNEEGSKIFLILYIPFSVIIVAGAIGQVASIELEKKAEEKRLKLLSRKLDFDLLRELDTDGSGVDVNTFLIAMLQQTDKVDKKVDIDPWLKKFKELDADGSGSLDQEDIALLEKQEKERISHMGDSKSTTTVGNVSANPVLASARAGTLGDSLLGDESSVC